MFARRVSIALPLFIQETHWLTVSLSVLPEGPEAIRGQELGSEYYEAAAPVIELQVARAGYRLAAWLDSIVSALKTESESSLGDL